jgi:hypothetical protein
MNCGLCGLKPSVKDVFGTISYEFLMGLKGTRLRRRVALMAGEREPPLTTAFHLHSSFGFITNNRTYC